MPLYADASRGGASFYFAFFLSAGHMSRFYDSFPFTAKESFAVNGCVMQFSFLYNEYVALVFAYFS
jgi:hypothetical protein